MVGRCVWVLAGVLVAVAVGTARAAEGVFFEEGFEDGELGKRGWYDGERFRTVGGALRGAGCIEYEWNEKGGGVGGSGAVRRLFEPSEEVFLRYHIRLSKGWGWSGKGFHPHMTHFLTTENGKFHGPAASRLTVYIEPMDGKLRLAAQDIQNKDAPRGLTQGPLRGGYNGTMFDSKEKLFVDDRWHCVEAQFKLNSVDAEKGVTNRDGVVRGWFDGKLVVERTDVVLRSADFPRMKFNQFLLAPYFGPGLVPGPQKLWIDELAVGTRRIEPVERGE